MRDRVVFEARDETAAPDEYGNVAGDGWEEQFTLSCQAIELSGTQKVEGGFQQEQHVLRIVVRNDENAKRITNAWRAQYDGREWNIQSKTHRGNKRAYLEITAISGRAT